VNYSVDLAKMLQKIYKDHKVQIYKFILERLRGMVFAQSGEFIMLVWTDLSEIKELDILLDLLGPFSEIIFKNMGRRDKNILFSMILDTFSQAFDNLRSIDKSIFGSFRNFIAGIL